MRFSDVFLSYCRCPLPATSIIGRQCVHLIEKLTTEGGGSWRDLLCFALPCHSLYEDWFMSVGKGRSERVSLLSCLPAREVPGCNWPIWSPRNHSDATVGDRRDATPEKATSPNRIACASNLLDPSCLNKFCDLSLTPALQPQATSRHKIMINYSVKSWWPFGEHVINPPLVRQPLTTGLFPQSGCRLPFNTE